jgi:MFS family permease
MSTQFQLLKEQRFRPFFVTQFLGAFNDNVFKTALITLVAFHASNLTAMSGSTLATLLPALFILPFFLFSATAGQLADKYEKSRIIRIIKMFEIAIMLFASAGFFMNNIWLLATALFMMGMHSTFFGPVKYSYLPQHLAEQELVGGNGMVEMGSFVAILLGQVLGAWLGAQDAHATMTSIAILFIAALGYWFSRKIPCTPATAPHLKINWNPFTETLHNLRFAWAHQQIWLALVAISWFWFYGATLLAQFPNFAKSVLNGDESAFILLLSTFSLGIGIGSLLCEKLSAGKVELGLVLFGGLGMTFFGADIYLATANLHTTLEVQRNFLNFLSSFAELRLIADIILLGIFAGFYIVPLYVLMQTRAEKSHQSRVIAANNILNALLMVASAGFSMWMFEMGFDIPQLFLLTALVNILVMLYLCLRQPEYFSAFVGWLKRISN